MYTSPLDNGGPPPPRTLDFGESPIDPPPEGGLDLGLFEKSDRPSWRGSWTLDFSESQIDPPNAWKPHENHLVNPLKMLVFRLLAAFLEGLLLLGGLDLGLFEMSTRQNRPSVIVVL